MDVNKSYSKKSLFQKLRTIIGIKPRNSVVSLVFNYNSFNSCFSDKLWEPDRLGVAGAGIALHFKK
jgi:hypothetical protein